MKTILLFKLAIVIIVILSVVYFTMSRLIELRTTYGEYGNGNFVADKIGQSNDVFYFPFAGKKFNSDELSVFEKETIYREVIKYKYDLMFKKIWTFSFIIFSSTFLLLYAMGKNKEKRD